MQKGQKQVLFSNGKVGEKTAFMLDNSQYDAIKLVAELKSLGFKHPDLDLYFSQGTKYDQNNEDITWEISDQHSSVTFEFFNLSDRPELQDDIEARSHDLLNQLNDFYQGPQCQNTQNQKLAEVLGKILVNRKKLVLYAGANPQKPFYFPVIVGWSGSFVESEDQNSILTGRDSTGRDPTDLEEEETGLEPTNGTGTSVTPISTKKTINWLFWLLWALILILALLIAFMLIPSCGFGKYFSNCEDQSTRIGGQETYYDNLQRQLTIKNNLCVSPIKPNPPKFVPEVSGEPIEAEPEVNNRLEDVGAKKSKLMASLIWNTKEDLDLSITCPNGEKVNHSRATLESSNCGSLDVDANVISASNKITDQPIEHILLEPSLGTYKINVRSIKNKNSSNDGSSTPFNVEVNDGGEIKQFSGEIIPGKDQSFTFTR